MTTFKLTDRILSETKTVTVHHNTDLIQRKITRHQDQIVGLEAEITRLQALLTEADKLRS